MVQVGRRRLSQGPNLANFRRLKTLDELAKLNTLILIFPMLSNLSKIFNGEDLAKSSTKPRWDYISARSWRGYIGSCRARSTSVQHDRRNAMASKNAERLKRYKARLRAAGFKRLSFWVCADLAERLAAERKPRECGGRVLERLLLGEVAMRPEYWTDAERARPRAWRQSQLTRALVSAGTNPSGGQKSTEDCGARAGREPVDATAIEPRGHCRR